MRDAWLTLWISKDGNRDFGAARQAFLGEEGDFRDQVTFRRLGQCRRMGVKVSITSPTRVDVLALEADISREA